MRRSRWISFLLSACLFTVAEAQVTEESDTAPSLAAAEFQDSDDAIEPEDLPGTEEEGENTEVTPALWAPLPVREEVPDEPSAVAASPELEEMSATPRRFRYELSVEVRGVADDNVTLAHENPEDDVYGQISAEITLGVGDVIDTEENYVSLNYTPTASIFAEHSEFNTVEHIARLEGQWRLSRLVLALGQDVRSIESSTLDVETPTGGVVNEVNLDVGGRRRLNTYLTHFDAEYELTGKTSARAEADFSSRDYEELIGSTTLAGGVGLSYRYGPKLRLGVIARLGKDFVDAPSPDQTFQQANLRFDYELTGKLKTTGFGGIQFRQSGQTEGTHISPVFNIGITYTPFDGTAIGLSGSSRTFNSASAVGRDFSATQIVFRARQRLFRRFYLALATGYQNQSYFSTIEGVEAERTDNYYFFVPAVEFGITRFWSAGVYYLERQNDSSTEEYSFEASQFGLRTTLQF